MTTIFKSTIFHNTHKESSHKWPQASKQLQELQRDRFCHSRIISELCTLSHVWLFAIPWTVAHQAPPYVRFPRQESWSGFPVPSPEDLPDPGIKPASLAWTGRFLTTEPPGKPLCVKPLKSKGFWSLGPVTQWSKWQVLRLNWDLTPDPTCGYVSVCMCAWPSRCPLLENARFGVKLKRVFPTVMTIF